MIKDYKRPESMADALKYFGDKSIFPVVLSGGSYQTEFTGIEILQPKSLLVCSNHIG